MGGEQATSRRTIAEIFTDGPLVEGTANPNILGTTNSDALTLGGNPATLEFWFREAESNCCRVVPVKRVFEDFVRFPIGDLLQFQSGDGTTLADWLRSWFERCGGVAWSEAADGYVLGVR